MSKKIVFCMLFLTSCASLPQKEKNIRNISDDKYLNNKPISSFLNHYTKKDEYTNWWEVYNDPQLNNLVKILREDSPRLNLAEDRLQLATANYHNSQSNKGLNINATADFNGEQFPDHFWWPQTYAGSLGSQGSFLFNIRYHLDLWGKWRNRVRSAKYIEISAYFQKKYIEISLTSAIVNLYINLDYLYKKQDLLIEKQKNTQAINSLLKIRKQSGLLTDLGQLDSFQQLTNIQIEIVNNEKDIIVCKNAIAALLGKETNFANNLKRPSIKNITQPIVGNKIPTSLVGLRPDIAAQRSIIESMQYSVKAAKAEFYPNVDLVAFAGFHSLDIGYLFRSGSLASEFGPAITLPIFNSGQLKSNLKSQIANLNIAIDNYNNSISQSIQQITDGIAEFQKSQKEITEITESIQTWKKGINIQTIRKQSGLSDRQNILVLNLSLITAKQNLLDEQLKLNETNINLILALGGKSELTPDFIKNDRR